MQFTINKVPYTVEVREMLSTSDPDDTGHCNTKTKTIELLAGQELTSALLTLSHEVCHAWLKDHITPRTNEQFCKVGEALLINFYDEFTRQGGRAALADLMGVPFEGNVDVLDAADWGAMSAEDKRRLIIRNTICAKFSQAMFEVFMARCDAAGLDPLRGDCYPVPSFDSQRRVQRLEMRTTIKAIRRIGQRSPRYAGVTSQEWCREGGPWLDVWPDRVNPPFAARCGIITTDSPEPKYFVAHWEEFAQTYVDRDGEVVLNEFWRRMPAHMLGKCAEAGAHARSIPECDGIYLAEQSDGGAAKVTARHAVVLEKRQAAAERRDVEAAANDGEPAPSPYKSAAEKLEALRTGAAFANVKSEEDAEPAAGDDTDDRLSARDERWVQVIREAARSASRADAIEFLASIREQCQQADNGDLEVENAGHFETLLAEQARKRFGRRRSA